MSKSSFADLRISELLERIGSDSVSPGAGAAGAVTLALAAACAAKAMAISMKHSEGNADLAATVSSLEKIRDFALQGAEADSRAFADFMRHRGVASAAGLIETGEEIAHLIGALLAIIAELESRISPSMMGDLTAARALAAAARAIQSSNELEAMRQQQALADQPFKQA